MSTFTLATSCLTTSNLLDSWTWHSRFLCNIAVYSIRPCFYHQSHPQLGIVFALAPSLHSFWSYFSTISSSILGTYWPGEFIFQCPICLPFHTVHGVLKARILKWFAVKHHLNFGKKLLFILKGIYTYILLKLGFYLLLFSTGTQFATFLSGNVGNSHNPSSVIGEYLLHDCLTELQVA